MSDEQMVEVKGCYKKNAKDMIDLFHNNEFFRKGTTRDQMNAIEDYIGLVIQQHCENMERNMKLLEKWKKLGILDKMEEK